MAYYNQYPYQPLGYAPMQTVQTPGMQNPQQNQQGGIIWVQGEAAAKSYLVAPGSTVQLWDSEEKVIYLKSADVSGMPSIKILDYTIRGDSPAAQAPEYATRDELNELPEKVKELAKRRRTRGEDGDE